jgi:hypothetical protein
VPPDGFELSGGGEGPEVGSLRVYSHGLLESVWYRRYVSTCCHSILSLPSCANVPIFTWSKTLPRLHMFIVGLLTLDVLAELGGAVPGPTE